MADQAWDGQVARLNEAISDAEKRLNEQITFLSETAERGQNTTEAETLIDSCRHHLSLLHSLHADLLQKDDLV